jgi:hypothetical protein
MPGVVDVLREILALTENVRRLGDDVTRLTAYVDELRSRVTRLEERESLVVEKTRNAAIMAVNRMNGELLERLVALEFAIRQPTSTSPSRSTKPLLPAADTAASDDDDDGA